MRPEKSLGNYRSVGATREGVCRRVLNGSGRVIVRKCRARQPAFLAGCDNCVSAADERKCREIAVYRAHGGAKNVRRDGRLR